MVGEERLLSKVEFQRLADVLAEAKWFANLEERKHEASISA